MKKTYKHPIMEIIKVKGVTVLSGSGEPTNILVPTNPGNDAPTEPVPTTPGSGYNYSGYTSDQIGNNGYLEPDANGDYNTGFGY